MSQLKAFYNMALGRCGLYLDKLLIDLHAELICWSEIQLHFRMDRRKVPSIKR